MKESMILKKKTSIVGRKVHGAFFLINIADNYKGDKCAIYEINETGMYIWNNINGVSNIYELASMLKTEIVDEVDLQVILNDVKGFVNTLLNNNFVEVCDIG